MGNNSTHNFSFKQTEKNNRTTNVHFEKSFTPYTQSNASLSKRINHNSSISHSVKIPVKTTWPSPHRETVFLPEFKLRPKVSFSDFDTIQTIGKGGFGHVLKVNHQATSEIYALKVIDKAEVIRLKATKQCKDEISIHSILDSPYITQCFYAWQTKRHLYILMELAEGGDLFCLWCRQRQFPVDLVKFYLAEIAVGLDYLHTCGIIFRDLKLENILIDKFEHALISDFGLSKKLEVGQRTRTICGTMQYMAPEILGGYLYNHAVDYWALGIIMYTLLMGNYPFMSEKNHIQMYHKVSTTGPTYSKQLEIHTISLMNALLNPNQQQRISNSIVLQSQPFFKTIDFYRLKTRQKIQVNSFKREDFNYKIKINVNSESNEMDRKQKIEKAMNNEKTKIESNTFAELELRGKKSKQNSVTKEKPIHCHFSKRESFKELKYHRISYEYYPNIDRGSKVANESCKGTIVKYPEINNFNQWI